MCNKLQTGFTLIEMVIAIVIIGVGLAGLLMAFNVNVKSSADPMINKQMLAVAETMLEEVLLKPFVPLGVAPVNGVVTCSVAASRLAFDDVADYNNYQTNGICDIEGGAVAGLGAYGLRITVAADAGFGGLASAAVKKITVVVTQGGQSMTLIGWRTNYAAAP